MIRDIDIGKKDDLSKLVAEPLSIKDSEIRSRPGLLRSSSNNDSFQPPPQPQHPPQPPELLRRADFFQLQAPFHPPPQGPKQHNFSGPALRIPPSPLAPPLLPDGDYFLKKKTLTPNIDENTQNLISELEQVNEKSEKKNEKLEVDTPISTYFNDVEEILNRNYLEKIENEKEELKAIERENNASHIREQINHEVTPEEIEFYFGGDDKKFFNMRRPRFKQRQ